MSVLIRPIIGSSEVGLTVVLTSRVPPRRGSAAACAKAPIGVKARPAAVAAPACSRVRRSMAAAVMVSSLSSMDCLLEGWLVPAPAGGSSAVGRVERGAHEFAQGVERKRREQDGKARRIHLLRRRLY